VRASLPGAGDADGREASGFQVGSPEDAAWDVFVARWPDGHLFQTSPWGALKGRFGWGVERVALSRGDAIVAGAQMLYRPLPLGLTLGYVPKGPLVDWRDDQAVTALLGAMRCIARRRGAFCLKLEPDLADDPTLASRLVHHGLRPSPQTVQPRSTLVVDLDRGEDQILSGMKSKCRYNIRLAARKGVVTREGSVSDLPAFQRLMQETAERDDFAVHSADYYHAAYDLFVPSGQARLLLASYEGAILAGIMVFALGSKAWYMYGASSNQHRNLMPNHLLQWEAIRWARARGCLTYDLWGIPDQSVEVLEKDFTRRSDGLWGVYRFKRGFGGRLVRYLGAYDDVSLGPIYWLYRGAAGLLQRGWGETWHRRLRSG